MKKKSFQDLDILISSDKVAVQNIPKIMLFVDKINKGILAMYYLQSMLSNSMRTDKKQIICPFSLNLLAKTRETFMQDFKLKNTHILVCTNTIGMRVNI